MAKLTKKGEDLHLEMDLQRAREILKKHFSRSELLDCALTYIRSHLKTLSRSRAKLTSKKPATISQRRIQHFMGRAKWNADNVQDSLFHFIDWKFNREIDTVILSEFRFLKKGVHSCGVFEEVLKPSKRKQNWQLGLIIASKKNKSTFITDRSLYLPREWVDNPIRKKKAGIPVDVTYQSKVELAVQMISRIKQNRQSLDWASAGEDFGTDIFFQNSARHLGLSLVFEVSPEYIISISSQKWKLKNYLDTLPTKNWAKLAMSTCMEVGFQLDWFCQKINSSDIYPFERRLLICRSVGTPQSHSFFICHCPSNTTISKLAEVAGGIIEMKALINLAKTVCGIAEYELRSWAGWHRHVTLCLYALTIALSYPQLYRRE